LNRTLREIGEKNGEGRVAGLEAVTESVTDIKYKMQSWNRDRRNPLAKLRRVESLKMDTVAVRRSEENVRIPPPADD
jgi:hypothetical protein